MEQAIRDNDFVLIVGTPKYKDRADNRKGGVGYEGDIMTGEVLGTSNHRKFIPILRQGTWDTGIPTWLKGKFGLDFSGDPYSDDQYASLLATLFNRHDKGPPVRSGAKPAFVTEKVHAFQVPEPKNQVVPVKIEGVIVDEVGSPRNDGTRGSALYTVPFKLNRSPSYEWGEYFLQAWRHPPSSSLVHRPRIASVSGNKIILDGTTIQEIKDYHQKTLTLCVDAANREEASRLQRLAVEEARKAMEKQRHDEEVRRISGDIRF